MVGDEARPRQFAEPVMTVLGSIWGRDTLFLEAIDLDYRGSCLTLRGMLDGAHTSITHPSAYIPFVFRFRHLLHVEMTELDLSRTSERGRGSFSFVEVKNSGWLSRRRQYDHSAKISSEHHHYVVATYDEVFEVVCISVEIELDLNAAR